MDIDTVSRAVDQLREQGQEPSVRKVQALVGGSNRDVSRLLREIRERAQMPQAPADEPAPACKVYRCQRYPHLRLGAHIKFSDGIYQTDDPAEQAAIERSDGYGVYIYTQAEATASHA